MGRKNHTGRRPQARRVNQTVAAPLPKLIIPRGRCHLPHHKLRFTFTEAEQALKQARHKRRRLHQEGHVEKRIYHCKTSDGGCGDWHLTARA